MDEVRNLYAQVMADNGMVFTHTMYKPRPWLVSMDMYNDLAPWFGHKPIPPGPKFPGTDHFINSWQTNTNMTEQGLIDYAKHGNKEAQATLEQYQAGIDWDYAITEINGRQLSLVDIKTISDEITKVADLHSMGKALVRDNLQQALNTQVALRTIRPADIAGAELAAPWPNVALPGTKRSKHNKRTPSNRTPPKKKRK